MSKSSKQYSIKNFGIHKLIFFLLLQVAACTSNKSDSRSQVLQNVPHSKIDKLNIFLSAQKNNIGSPYSVDILPDGKLAVLDTHQNKIMVYRADGQLDHAFGRRGKGPGEFIAPRLMQTDSTTINIIDVALQRVNQFKLDGTFVRNYHTNRESAHFGFIATGARDEYYTVANGHNGKLVGHHFANIDSAIYFGTAPVANPPKTNNRQAFKQSIAEDKPPAAISNDIVMDYVNGALYVYLKAFSRLQKYASDGKLKWDKKLSLPVNKAIFNDFAEQFQKSQMGFPVLRYIEDMTATHNNIYLLWNSPPNQPQQIVQVQADGTIAHVYEIPKRKDVTFNGLSVDDSRNRFYLVSERTAKVYSGELTP